jgi:hypothetical protein
MPYERACPRTNRRSRVRLLELAVRLHMWAEGSHRAPDALIVLAREILDISRRYLHEDFKRSWEEAGLVPDRPRDQLEAPYRWAPKGDPWAPVEAL